jgi:hypothetical protein
VIGESAGRARKHPTGSGAVGRSTERQRLGLVPPPTGDWVAVTTRERYIRRAGWNVAICLALAVVGSISVMVFGNLWMKLIGLGLLLSAIAVAGLSKPWRFIRTDLVLEDVNGPQRRT